MVKWRSLPYVNCTWETALTLVGDQQALRQFRAFEAAPSPLELRVTAQGSRPPRSNWHKLKASPVFKSGNKLRPYQLEGLNWLLFSWYCRRSVMLADEMGLGKTVQSVATLNYIWKHEHIRGPFLVVAPLSTLSHWQREFEQWTDMNAIVYHGSYESREVLRRYEFHFADGQANPSLKNAHKFHALITSYEVIKLDLDRLRKISWRYMVIDEAHRLKNKDSALASELRSLRVEHMHLLTGTPLQNNTTELWALLSFLDPQLFPTLEGYLDEYGTLMDSQQVDRLNEKIRPYLLRRQKADVEKSLTPLEETIIWVEMTIYQKKCYKAVLEGNRDILLRGITAAAMPSLVNIQMELRKCCNHPYLITGVEASQAEGLQQGQEMDATLRASGKYVLLDKLLPKLKAEGHRVLIFSQMTRVLDILEDYCAYRREEGFYYCRIDGSTAGDDRQDAIDAFNRPDSDRFIFLLSTRAGGLGINLQTADIVIIYDSDWNPQADLQAMDRAHRIGQKKEVKVFRFVTADSIEEKVVERAELKLQMDYAVIQQGRLAEKQKALSKEEALAVVRYGADKVFRADDADITEEDIDTILRSAKNLTAEREGKLKEKAKRELLDFSNAEVNFQEFDGVDYKALKQEGDMVFMEMMQDSMGKRERTNTSYAERDFMRASGPTTSSDKALPKAKKLPDMKDFQLFDHKRIAELAELEYAREVKRVKAAQRAAEAGAAEPELQDLTPQEQADVRERERLEAEGFPFWSRHDYAKFLKACERHGRDKFQQIADEIGTKTVDEVKAYSAAFWERGPVMISDFDKASKKIEEGEKKILEKAKNAEALRQKVASCDNPWQTLSIKYGNNRGKLFTEEEDRFLMCMTNELGYGKWEELKREVRRHPEFRFDWLFKSRTPVELGRRVDHLIRLIQNENKEPRAKRAAAAAE
uniref:Uncharacterized protein n=1 Tax=Chrysotila carterae TaxID=13221 RepID=A0A7S4BX57_CHRCT